MLFDEWVKDYEPIPTSHDQVLERFVRYLRPEGLKDETIGYYEKKLRPLVDAWQDVPLDRWSRRMFEDYLASKPQWSTSSRRKMVAPAKRFRDWLVDQDADVRDFVGRFRFRKEPARQLAVLELKDVLRSLEAARSHRWLELPLGLAALAGLAKGDIRALDWAEVDLEAGVIRRPRQKRPDQTIRTPIVPPLRAILLRAYIQQGRPDSGPVCAGMPRNGDAMNEVLKRHEERSGVPAAPRFEGGWHRYRRSLASVLTGLGIEDSVIGAILAHTPGSKVTAMAYQVVPAEALQASMERFADAIEKAQG